MCEGEVQEQIQPQMGNKCPKENRLDDEVDELWNLMKFFRKIYIIVNQVAHCDIGLNMNNYGGKYSGA